MIRAGQLSARVAANESSPATSESSVTTMKRSYAWHESASTRCVLVLTIVAAILRLSFLGSKSLWFDESLTAYRVALPYNSLLNLPDPAKLNMPLYYLLLHEWTALAGSSEFMLRLPSAVFGVLTVPLVYFLGVQLGDRRAGLWAALLLTVNATCIEYAQTARSYSMFIALAMLASVCFISSVKGGSNRSFASYLVSAILAVYTHLFGIFALPSQWLSLFLFRPPRKTALALTGCMLAIPILSLPALVPAASGFYPQLSWVPRTSLHSLTEMFMLFAGALDAGPTILTALLTASYLTGIALAVRRVARPGPGYLLLSICVPVVLIVAISIVKPLFVPRYLLAELPLFALLAAIGLRGLKPALAIAMVCAIAMLSLGEDYAYYRAPSLEDWRGMVAFVATHSKPGDAMLIFPGYYIFPVGYYVAQREHPETFPHRIFTTPVAGEWNSVVTPERLPTAAELAGYPRVWLTSGQGLDRAAIEMMFPLERVVDVPEFAGVRLFLLERVR